MSKRRRNGKEESNVSICDIPSRRDVLQIYPRFIDILTICKSGYIWKK